MLSNSDVEGSLGTKVAIIVTGVTPFKREVTQVFSYPLF
jgi:hypothetical protein